MHVVKLAYPFLFAFLLFSAPALADDGRDSGGIGEEAAAADGLLQLTSTGQDCLSRERCRTACNGQHPDDDRAFNRCIQRCNRNACVD